MENKKGKVGPKYKYPWEKWLLRKKAITIHYGKDYHCQQLSMCVLIRRNATRLGRVITVTPTNDGAIKITPRGEVE